MNNRTNNNNPLTLLKERCKKHIEYLTPKCLAELRKKGNVVRIDRGTDGYITLIVMDTNKVSNVVSLKDIESCEKKESMLFKKTARVAALYDILWKLDLQFGNSHCIQSGQVKKVLSDLANKGVEVEEEKGENNQVHNKIVVSGLNDNEFRNIIKDTRETVFGFQPKSQAETESAEFLTDMENIIRDYRYNNAYDYIELQALFIENIIRQCERFLAYINAKIPTTRPTNTSYAALLEMKEHAAEDQYLVEKIRVVLSLRNGLPAKVIADDMETNNIKINNTITDIKTEANRTTITRHRKSWVEFAKNVRATVVGRIGVFKQKKNELTTESHNFLVDFDKEISCFNLRRDQLNPNRTVAQSPSMRSTHANGTS